MTRGPYGLLSTSDDRLAIVGPAPERSDPDLVEIATVNRGMKVHAAKLVENANRGLLASTVIEQTGPHD